MSLIRPVNPAESEKAIAQLMMSAPDKEKVRTALAEGKMRLGWVTLSDFEDEDGDWVRFMAGGFRQDVRLLHNAYTIAVPYVPGTPVSVTGPYRRRWRRYHRCGLCELGAGLAAAFEERRDAANSFAVSVFAIGPGRRNTFKLTSIMLLVTKYVR